MSIPALIVIDMQKGFSHPKYFGTKRNNEEAERYGRLLIKYWRNREWPIVIVHHASTEKRSPLRPDNKGHAPMEGFEVQSGDKHIVKAVNSAFIGTELEAWLRGNNIHDLVFCGATTDHCVSTTTRMAGNLGFKTTLVEDACFCFHKTNPVSGEEIAAEDIHAAHISSLNGEFAYVTTAGKLLDGLSMV